MTSGLGFLASYLPQIPPTPDDPNSWSPDNVIALVAVVASAITAVVVTYWSHAHDRKMRKT
jgi:hypothetical protein